MPPPPSGSKKKQRKKPALRPACYLLHAGFLLGLLFEPEDGNYIFPETTVDFQRTTWRYIPEEITLSLISSMSL
jgi:hypothetical protein